MKAGLVSVSFRKLSAEDVIDLAAECGLGGIEWGGDIHVPTGDIQCAEEIGRLTRARGLEVACYGSYCRLTDEEAAQGDFDRVVETAKALGAPLIRVWAGKLPSAEADCAYRNQITKNARIFARLAEKSGINVAFEYHGGTLTDTAQSALALLEGANLENIGCLWQPPVDMSTQDCLCSIRTVAKYIRNIHVFSWQGTDRLPLACGAKKWRACLGEIEKLSGDRWLLMEFVRDDDPAQLKIDAECLFGWLKGVWQA